ncbi:MAG: rRNA maturation RNase YbeY [Bacteroidales bacterium]|nr:rRNA maturation RNase YbeY [Bacteroidales bacterium]
MNLIFENELSVYFNYSEVSFRFKNEKELADWIKFTIQSELKRLGEINIVIVSDKEILIINKQYLNHNYFTDIITFSNNRKERISGEIYISLDAVKANAATLHTSFNEEMRRVLIHGVLHLIGYNDHTTREKNNMRKLEDKYLILYRRN